MELHNTRNHVYNPSRDSAPIMVVSKPPESRYPLFDYPGADFILRSCDSRDFRVSKLHITNSSPMLGELIQNASNSSDTTHVEGSFPAVQLPESGAILNCLLTFIFPVSPVLPSTIEETMELLSVAQKYHMDSALAHIRGGIARQDPSPTRPENAFHVYSLAQKYGLRQEALQAARTILSFSMTLENLEDKLDVIPGSSFHELWKYHTRVRSLLASDLAEFRTSDARGTLAGLRCTELSSSLIPRWLDRYIESIGRAPNLFDLIEFDIVRARHINDNNGCACACITSQTIRTFWTALAAVVHGSIEKAESALSLVQEGVNSQVGSTSKKGSRKVSFLHKSSDIPDADLIVRSNDHVNFRVHKSVLAMASPFFRSVFTRTPSPYDGVVDGLPVLPLLSLDSSLLDGLISILYPIRDRLRPFILPGWSYYDVLHLLAACQNYKLVSVQSAIRAELDSGAFPEPMGIGAFFAYAMASRKALIPEVEKAARLTLNRTMDFDTLVGVLQLFKGRELCDLVRFRRRCRDNVVACLESFLDCAGPTKIWVGCPAVSCHSSESRGVTKPVVDVLPRWLRDLFTRNRDKMQELTHPLIEPSSIYEEYLTALQTHTDCHFCLRVHATEGLKFCAELENKLVQARNKVCADRG
ncbi:hypothetical protein BJV78DRAFT_160446 [Lactifluus subvellereus]|nr:hypothetical protein BJV78DRAFT_160446 [Lactifluus subvellereus]